MTNPFVYGEIVPVAAFVDREVELDRLGRDLYAGQKVFLISPAATASPLWSGKP